MCIILDIASGGGAGLLIETAWLIRYFATRSEDGAFISSRSTRWLERRGSTIFLWMVFTQLSASSLSWMFWISFESFAGKSVEGNRVLTMNICARK